jgi:hypothetical protein
MTDGSHRVVIAGGGVAAIEAFLALRELAGQLLDITLISPQREFLYRPVTVAEAFDRGEARTYPLSEIVADGGRLTCDSVSRVELHERLAVTAGGERISYDTPDRRRLGAGGRAARGRPDVPRPTRRPGPTGDAGRARDRESTIGGADASIGADVAAAALRALPERRNAPT